MKIEEIKLIVSKQIQVGKNEIKTNLRAHGKVVSGRTLRSLRSETTNTPTTVTGRIWSTVSYFPAMERGRGPFKGGAERGLSERLYSWSKLKGISFQTDTQRQHISTEEAAHLPISLVLQFLKIDKNKVLFQKNLNNIYKSKKI